MQEKEPFADILRFFENKGIEYTLYRLLEEKILTQFPVERIRVQKTQIAFWARHPFTIVSLRRASGWPEHCIVVTFGLAYRLNSPRIAVATEPYPNRWTHHVVVSEPAQINQSFSAGSRRPSAFRNPKHDRSITV
ncbi:MAG TPA: hypothetical protein IAB39_05815 [Candidatus Onthovicinus excrementipullorum]|nr:hypothetical protein [Candidatus Onthovicinus excrementipullorum]